MSDAPSHNGSSSRRRNVNGDVIAVHIVLASPVLYVPADVTSLPIIQARVRLWVAEHHPSKVPGSKGQVDVPESSILDTYAADLDGEGD